MRGNCVGEAGRAVRGAVGGGAVWDCGPDVWVAVWGEHVWHFSSSKKTILPHPHYAY